MRSSERRSPSISACTSPLMRSSVGSARRASTIGRRYSVSASAAACPRSGSRTPRLMASDHSTNCWWSSRGKPMIVQITWTGKRVVTSATRSARPSGSMASMSWWITGSMAMVRHRSTADGRNAVATSARWRRCSSPSIPRIVSPLNTPAVCVWIEDEKVSASRTTASAAANWVTTTASRVSYDEPARGNGGALGARRGPHGVRAARRPSLVAAGAEYFTASRSRGGRGRRASRPG